MAENTNLTVPIPGGSMERPDFLKPTAGKPRGLENVTRADIQLPRLSLAQGQTPQVLESKEGFSAGVMFNSFTEEVFGKGPIYFTIIRTDRPRYIEFHPRNAGPGAPSGIKDMNVPPNDPRTRFGPNGEKPVATCFYDFVICILPLNPLDPMGTVISLSFKSTGIQVAKRLNTLMTYRDADTFAGRYELSTFMDRRDKYIFAQFKVENAGWVDQPTFKMCEKMYDLLKDKTIDFDTTPADGVDDETIEHEPQPASVGSDAIPM